MRREEIVEESDSTDNPSINGRYHRFNVKLGKGAFKEVYKAFDTHEQIDVAWNTIDLSLLHAEDERKKIFKECEMLRRLNHTNILKITDQWFDDKTDKLCFITNIVHDGSLAKFFHKRQVNLLRVKQICKQILNALLYLHSMGVIHRDLKCDNIFIEGNTGKVVLGDLGLSCNVVSARSIVGTPHWMAPELYREEYDERADIWSFGMCVLELITSTIPYSECKGTFNVYQNISAGKKPKSLKKVNDPYVRAFINICLNVKPSQRPSARELLEHPFLYRKPTDTTLCSQLMLPKKDDKEPPRTMEEKIEEKELQNTLTKTKAKTIKNNSNCKSRHDFHCERATSPAPQSQHFTATQNNINTEETKTQRKKKKADNVDIKFAKKDGDKIRIKLQITCSKFKKPMNVEFDFCHPQEKPKTVAIEMVSDLDLEAKFQSKVEKAIKNAVAIANKQQKKQNTTKLMPSKDILPPKPLSETKSRKSLGAEFEFNMTLIENSAVSAPNTHNLNILPTSSTSLTPDADTQLTQNSKTKDPMYSKPTRTPMSERMFGFSQTQNQNESDEPQTDYLTSDPPLCEAVAVAAEETTTIITDVPQLPPIPDVAYSYNPIQSTTPTTPPAPAPAPTIAYSHPRSHSITVLGTRNNNNIIRSRSASPGPQYIETIIKLNKNENKENIISDGVLALQSLNSKSTDTQIYKATLKLTEDELIQEFVKRSKKFNKSEGRNGLARKLVNVLIETLKTPTSTTAVAEIANKEASPDNSIFSAKSSSVESAVSIETAEQLMKKSESRRDSLLKLKDFDSGTSSHDYDIYTNNEKRSHKHSATTIIRHSDAYNAAIGDRDKKGIKTSKSAHTIRTLANGAYNTSYTNTSTMITVASLQLPFIIEELKLPSPSTGIVFDDDVLSQISKKQMELHLEYIEFVKRKYELLQLRYRTLEEEFPDIQQQKEIKAQEENGIKDKINNKRSELTDKFGEWLSDREQIALLKQRIEKKRSTSVDKLLAFGLQLEFENDPAFIQLMQSQLSDADKRECKLQIYSFRKEMMNKYKNFYLKTIQTYKDKVKQMHH